MSTIREDLINYGIKIAQAGLVAGAGGNISARDGRIVWMKPSGFAMDDMTPADLCGMDLATGKQIRGKHKPTSEVNMHLGIYRERPDTQVIFHVHSPWASGIFSSGAQLKPMFAEFICDLGRVGTIPYITPTTQKLADAVTKAGKKFDTIFMENHGMLAQGANAKQAFYRCLVVEDAAKSMIAAAIVGKPRFLTPKQQQDLLSLSGVQHRIKTMSK
jgi:L-fuculose-phosphate aldolase